MSEIWTSIRLGKASDDHRGALASTEDTVEGVLYLNPGSAGPRRFKLPITLATIDLTADAIRAEIHELIA